MKRDCNAKKVIFHGLTGFFCVLLKIFPMENVIIFLNYIILVFCNIFPEFFFCCTGYQNISMRNKFYHFIKALSLIKKIM